MSFVFDWRGVAEDGHVDVWDEGSHAVSDKEGEGVKCASGSEMCERDARCALGMGNCGNE